VLAHFVKFIGLHICFNYFLHKIILLVERSEILLYH